MKLKTRWLTFSLLATLAAGCSNGSSNGSLGGGTSGGSTGGGGGGVTLGNTPVLDFLLPYASADASGTINQITLVSPTGFAAPQNLTISTQATLAKINYLGTFDPAHALVQHSRPNLFYFVSNGSLYDVPLHVATGAAASQQLGSATNLAAASVCALNSLSDNLATGHVRIWFSLAGASASCAGSDLSSAYIGSDATTTTAPTAIPATGAILEIAQFHNAATGISSAAVITEANGEVLYVDGNLQNPHTIVAAGSSLPPAVIDSNAKRIVLAGIIPGTTTVGVYSIDSSGTVTTLQTAPAGNGYLFSSAAAANHTVYVAYGSTAATTGAYLASSGSVIYAIDETNATPPALVYSSANAITAFKALPAGLATLEQVPEPATPSVLDAVINAVPFSGGTAGTATLVDNAGPSATVTFSSTAGSLLLYNVRETSLPSGTPSQLANTAKIADISAGTVVSTQMPGSSWFGSGSIVNRDLSSDSLGGVIDIAQAFNLQQRDGTDAGKDSFFTFTAANLSAANYAGTAAGSVDYGSSVHSVSARGLTAREDTALGTLAVVYTTGSTALNDVLGVDDYNGQTAQVTNTPTVNELTN